MNVIHIIFLILFYIIINIYIIHIIFIHIIKFQKHYRQRFSKYGKQLYDFRQTQRLRR